MRKLVFCLVVLILCWPVVAVDAVGDKMYSDSNVSVSLDGSSITGVNVVQGVIYVGRNGSATFEWQLIRRGVNVSFTVLN